MFARFQRSWELTKQSAALLAKDKVLMVFPLMSGIATIALIISFMVPLFRSGAFNALHAGNATPQTYAVLFTFYFCCYFVQIFFNCALMASANMAFSGGRATLANGFSFAVERLGRIFVWALVSATVGLILRTLEERAGKLGRIVIALLGTAWSILTYFMVPVIVFEDAGVSDGIKRSGSLVKKTWGEGIGKGISFAAFALLGLIACAAVTIVGMMVHPLVGLLLLFSSFTVLVTAISAMDGIFKVALYRYACWGMVPEGFSSDMVQAAFAPKQQKGRFGF